MSLRSAVLPLSRGVWNGLFLAAKSVACYCVSPSFMWICTHTALEAAEMTRAACSSFDVIYMLREHFCMAPSVLSGDRSGSFIPNKTTHCQALRRKEKKKASEKYDRSYKTGQLYPIDNLQKPTFIGRFSQIKFYCASWAGRHRFCIAFQSLAFIWSQLLHLCDI